MTSYLLKNHCNDTLRLPYLTKINYQPEILFAQEVTEFDSTNRLENIADDPEKTALLIYTSGTTGSPKGVMLSYKNIQANIDGVSKSVEIYTPERQVLILLPLHHIFPLIGSMMAPLFMSASIALCPSMQSTDMLETLKNNRVAIMIGVPRLYELIYKGVKAKIDASFVTRTIFKIAAKIDNKKLSQKIFKKVHDNFGGHLTYLVSGGAALPAPVGGFFKTLGFEVLEGFGMTEAAPMITFTRPGRVRIGSPGEALPGLSLKIENDEILAKGPGVMQGYYNKPKETAQVLKNGWLYTGDLGYIDEKGYLFITGRKKEIIVLSNGKNINPAELEGILESEYDCIKEVGVFEHNNILHAIIVPDYEQLASLDVMNLENYFRKNVLTPFNKTQSSYKQIHQLIISKKELPRTRLSKIQRFKLPEFLNPVDENTAEDNQNVTAEFLALKEYIGRLVDVKITSSKHIEYDLGLDSLSKLGLIDYIEQRFGIVINVESLVGFASLGELADYIEKEKKYFHDEDGSNWTNKLDLQTNANLPNAWFTQVAIKSLCKVFFKLWFQFSGRGMENIPVSACIIAPNHQSFMDGVLVTSFLTQKQLKKTYFYAKEKHVKNAFLRFMASHNNVIVMDLHSNLKESIQKLASVLSAGNKVILFPEGTRSADGNLGEFKKTFAILSTRLNVPVVPVAIAGAYDALPAGGGFPKFGTKVSVAFLPAQFPERKAVEEHTKNIREAIVEELNRL